jgi:hypothetical protein
MTVGARRAPAVAAAFFGINPDPFARDIGCSPEEPQDGLVDIAGCGGSPRFRRLPIRRRCGSMTEPPAKGAAESSTLRQATPTAG